MKILVYNWYDNSSPDAIDALYRMGHTVGEVKYQLQNKLHDEDFESQLCRMIKEQHFEAVFSFDYFPVLSLIADECRIKYISWVYDSPHDTLYSKAVFNDCNYIFCFDRLDAERLRREGVKHVYHMPLAVNVRRLDTLFCNREAVTDYNYDVSFVGSLYRDKYNFYDYITLPEYYMGFLDGVMRTQMELYGCDIIPELITDNLFKNIESVFSINENDELLISKKQYFIQFIYKKITSIERVEILKALSEKFDVTLFSGNTDAELEHVKYKGYIDYEKGMPGVFRSSRINLNITLRSIVSGIPLRCMDIMGAGGFLLSNYQPELNELFSDGEEMVMYTSRDDLMNKVEYYLSHDSERRDIAINGCKKVREQYNIDKSLDKILSILD